ncbi:hypothetical protein CHS0354_033117 [Potamilus streckersoni]|uniref:DBB domain-containing protein n=1 Tax=Potamilus streckersoni TaxID=2493646 RepID=A0AAE0S6B3_9BIVA|nr:hypothetical protein CHS0354_033117 [Potamilus streckersoni]
MSRDICHCIFYQFDGETCAHTIKDFFSKRRYNVQFILQELQNANITHVSNPGIFILLLTPDSYDFIQTQKHLDLNAIFPNPEFTVILLFHVQRTQTEIATLLSCRIRDFSKFIILEYSSPSTLAIDIMDLVEQVEEKCTHLPPQQKCQVWPREAVKTGEQVLLIFMEPVDEDSRVEFVQEWNGLTRMAERLNPMTFCFTVDVEPGERILEVMVNDTSFGKVVLHVQHVESKMEEITTLLKSVLSPIELLCQCLHIAPSTRENLDRELLDLLCNNAASVSHVFDELDWKRFRDSNENYELPTLLHFGAKYGLKLFCMELLRLPGCKQAMKMTNKNGLLPYQIAEKEGYDSLAWVLQNSEKDLCNSAEFETHPPSKDQIKPSLQRRMTDVTIKPATLLGTSETSVSVEYGKMKRRERHYESIDDQ